MYRKVTNIQLHMLHFYSFNRFLSLHVNDLDFLILSMSLKSYTVSIKIKIYKQYKKLFSRQSTTNLLKFVASNIIKEGNY